MVSCFAGAIGLLGPKLSEEVLWSTQVKDGIFGPKPDQVSLVLRFPCKIFCILRSAVCRLKLDHYQPRPVISVMFKWSSSRPVKHSKETSETARIKEWLKNMSYVPRLNPSGDFWYIVFKNHQKPSNRTHFRKHFGSLWGVDLPPEKYLDVSRYPKLWQSLGRRFSGQNLV